MSPTQQGSNTLSTDLKTFFSSAQLFLILRTRETALISNSSLCTIIARTSSGRRTRCYTRKRPSPSCRGVCLTPCEYINGFTLNITDLCLICCFPGNRTRRSRRRRKASECGWILRGVQLTALNKANS